MRKTHIIVSLLFIIAITVPGQEVWKAENSGTTATLTDVTYGNEQFVAVGSGGAVITSPDGKTWMRQA
jgi:hypothetical protein